MEKILVAADHGGAVLAQALTRWLKENDYQVENVGAQAPTPRQDAPEMADRVLPHVKNGQARGILICSSGVGMSIRANRYIGIRAAVVTSETAARHCREHNDANVLCLGAHIVAEQLAIELVKVFLETEFLARDRYIRRNQALDIL
ncbi:MAG: RpiB/LacA/LacB family sugar-phosphate isomerase [Alphaproteobacteria bacterium]|nr:RpiB/LacA/LacB family sugar-phosphate isomerase [Alphaproteobacteria bacterium]MDD9920420.1 RpiB/LacA/LacB family sugar-phosphate isomerase [Alphaproteobacteria bacterium]